MKLFTISISNIFQPYPYFLSSASKKLAFINGRKIHFDRFNEQPVDPFYQKYRIFDEIKNKLRCLPDIRNIIEILFLSE